MSTPWTPVGARRRALAALLLTASLVLAVGAQAVTSGALPTTPSLVVGALLAGVLGAGVLRDGHRPGPGSLLAAQVALHVWFVLSSPTACGVDGGLAAAGPRRAVSSCLGAAGTASSHGLGVLALHVLPVLLATVLLAALLRHDEPLLDAAAATVLAVAALARPRVPVRVETRRPARAARPDGEPAPGCGADLPGHHGRRGPPASG